MGNVQGAQGIVASDDNLLAIKDSLWAAIGSKQYIVNNQAAYYYNVTIETKHTHRICGIRSDPSYSYHTERRFNYNQYNNDLANVDAQISGYKQAIQNKLRLFTDNVEVLSNESVKYITDKNKTQINQFQADYYKITQINSELNYRIQTEKSKITPLTGQFNDTRSKVSNLPNLIQSEKIKNTNNQEILKAKQIVNTEDALETEKQNKETYDFVKAVTARERAFFLAEMIDQPNTNSVINIIKSLGFDATCLGFIACQQNRSDLFDLALKYSADCTSTKIEGATILQHAIKAGLDSFITKILDHDEIDVCATLALALEQNDIVTIEKLFSLEVNLSYQKIHGYTLLQYAICCDRKDIAKKILEINPQSADILTANNESAFMIALRSANTEIIKLMAKYSNLIEIAKTFIEKDEALLLNKILTADIMNNQMKQELYLYALQRYDEPAINIFKSPEHNYDFINHQEGSQIIGSTIQIISEQMQ